MIDVKAHLRRMFAYSDLANATVLRSAGELPDAHLDQPIDIGPAPGSLRRILVHTYNGERVWLSRQKGNVETPWPTESVVPAISQLLADFQVVAQDREVWLSALEPTRLEEEQSYRDSRGSLFRATLMDMILQGLTHSVHHRAQATNAIRRLGGKAPELDYMYHHRRPA
jgi:uncharacterized damage-inducible protein DinB